MSGIELQVWRKSRFIPGTLVDDFDYVSRTRDGRRCTRRLHEVRVRIPDTRTNRALSLAA